MLLRKKAFVRNATMSVPVRVNDYLDAGNSRMLPGSDEMCRRITELPPRAVFFEFISRTVSHTYWDRENEPS